MIVDGKVAFIGGVGIADEWAGNGEGTAKYRENQYEVTGPVVAQLQGAFLSRFGSESTGSCCMARVIFHALTQTGTYSAQTISSSTWDGNLDFLYRLGIASAQKTLRIENAYFLPDKLIRQELVAAAKRGVKVEVTRARGTDRQQIDPHGLDEALRRVAEGRHQNSTNIRWRCCT